MLAYDELSEYGVEHVFHTVEQTGVFLDSSSDSEEGDTESDDA